MGLLSAFNGLLIRIGLHTDVVSVLSQHDDRMAELVETTYTLGHVDDPVDEA